MKRTGLVGATVMAIVAYVALFAVSPAQAYTLFCSGKTKAEVAACDTSGFADHMHKSYWRAYSGHNCTNYAAYRMSIAGVPTPSRTMGNGNQWAGNARELGYTVNTTPAVGAIASWSKPNNHVGYVEEVGKDYLVISDSAYTAKVFKRYRVNKRDSWYPNEFIHFLGAPAPAPKPTATPTPTPKPSATPTPTPKPSATPTPKPTPTATVAPAPKPAKTTISVKAPATVSSTEKPKVKVVVKSGGARVKAAGKIVVYRDGKKIKTVKYAKSAKGVVTFAVPNRVKGNYAYTFKNIATKKYKKSSTKKKIVVT